eukprot:CAMPEP_0182527740 /NCGR_PEP_ID=MMETSP1323-20130603/4047_1 /TAXON_ID=236787 /ORGANISM="Florenciella parvula, Strain RCC1693" /LENGTH=58 /DNA_ID=CAMNT_0024736765 /DNA_START=1254 /DNA_END=1427 /DNA_ORIENTATION=-
MNTPSSTYTKTSRVGAGIMVWMTLGTPRIPEEDPLEAGRAVGGSGRGGAAGRARALFV